MMFEFNEKLCTGCGACVVACMDLNDTDLKKEPQMRRLERTEDEAGGTIIYRVLSCLHCEEPECAAACPTGAMQRDADGFITADREKCVACGACARSCPHGGVPGDDGREKCGGCRERALLGLTPVCVEACPVGAVVFKWER